MSPSALSIPANFWPAFARDHWGKTPVVYRQPFAGALASEADVLAALRELGRRLAAGDERIHFRLHRAGEPVSDAAASLPVANDTSWETYAGRLAALHGERGYGIIINAFQALDPQLYQRSVEFLVGLYAEVGIPSGGALIDMITGNYKRSFLDFHKDDQDVFTFVVAGHKRILAWPFETFRQAAGLGERDHGISFQMQGFDYRPYLDQAMVLEGGPGDLFYWPASYWHVAEGDGGSAPLTLTVAMIKRGSPTLHLCLTRRGVGEESGRSVEPFARPGHPLAAHLARLRHVIDVPQLQRALEEEALRFISRAGYKMVPEPLPPPVWEGGERVRLVDPLGLAWFGRDGELVVAARGMDWVAPRARGAEAVLEALTGGQSVAVQSVAGDIPRRILASLWQQRVLALAP